MLKPTDLIRRLTPSLILRVALGLALVGLVPVAVIAVRLIGLNRDAMTEQVEHTHALAARTAAERVDAFLDTRISLIRGISSNAALARPRSPEARALLRDNLAAWQDLGVLGVEIVNPLGEQAILAQLSDETVKQRVAAALALPGLGQVVVHSETGEATVRMESPLPEEIGWIRLVASGEGLLDALEAFELGDQAEMVLARRDGSRIVGADVEFPAALLEQAGTRWLQGVSPSFRLDGDETDFVGAYAPVGLAEWTVLSRQPVAIAQRVALRMQREAAIAVGAASALVALLSLAAYATVVRPIRRLIRSQSRLAGMGGAGGGDEITQLEASFDALRRRLRDREALDEVFVGRYQILRVLGMGSMGTVFLARDSKLERHVALKTLRLDTKLGRAQRQDLVSRLLREAIAVARFNHPNIVAVYDVEDRPEAAFIAMEYVDGLSLERLIWSQRRLPEELVLPLGAAVARGLAEAHSRDVVHRDVKPANILLGTDGAIKVTDFGIAELMSSLKDEEDTVFGTPGYLPPETALGLGYDESGDLFALGAVLYFSLTGIRPFAAPSAKEAIRRTLLANPRPPRSRVPEASEELDALILELLTADRAARPSDAVEVAERLEALAAARDARWELPALPQTGPEARPAEPAPPVSAGDLEAQFVATQRLTASTRKIAGLG